MVIIAIDGGVTSAGWEKGGVHSFVERGPREKGASPLLPECPRRRLGKKEGRAEQIPKRGSDIKGKQVIDKEKERSLRYSRGSFVNWPFQVIK